MDGGRGAGVARGALQAMSATRRKPAATRRGLTRGTQTRSTNALCPGVILRPGRFSCGVSEGSYNSPTSRSCPRRPASSWRTTSSNMYFAGKSAGGNSCDGATPPDASSPDFPAAAPLLSPPTRTLQSPAHRAPQALRERADGGREPQVVRGERAQGADAGRRVAGAEEFVEGDGPRRGRERAELAREEDEHRVHPHRDDAKLQQVDQTLAAAREDFAHVDRHSLKPSTIRLERLPLE